MSVLRRAGHLLVMVLLALGGATAQAHKASDAYLQLDAGADGLTVRWDIALRDLDTVLDLDADADGRITWAEVKVAWPHIEAYALAHLSIDGCPLRPTGRALERRNDGAYAVLLLRAACQVVAMPTIGYTLFDDVDPTHRGITKLQRPGEPVVLAVLDPTAGPAAAAPGDRAAPRRAASSRWAFVGEGVHHILTGYDHVLFLLCLLLPSVMRRTPRGWQPVGQLSQAVLPVIGIVSAFTLAHSITLALAALKVVSLAPAFIEPAIALTIVLAALDNLWPVFPVPRVVVTFLFGLIHGFGFAGVLAELDLPTADFAWALLQFNLGLEAGQVMIVIGVTSLLFWLRRSPLYAPWVIRGGSFAAIMIGLLWLIERIGQVSLWPL